MLALHEGPVVSRYERADRQATLRKGDRFRFTEDYFVDTCRLSQIPDFIKAGKPTRRLIGAKGTEGRVIWAGRSYDNPRFGVWRVGVIVPGFDKPKFINQRYMEKI